MKMRAVVEIWLKSLIDGKPKSGLPPIGLPPFGLPPIGGGQNL